MIVAPETRPRDIVKVQGRSPLTGLSVGNLSPALAEELSLEPSAEGVVVTDVEPDSAAGQIGFQKGDIIVAINRETMGSSKDVDRAAASRPRGWELTLTRGGRTFTTVVRG